MVTPLRQVNPLEGLIVQRRRLERCFNPTPRFDEPFLNEL